MKGTLKRRGRPPGGIAIVEDAPKPVFAAGPPPTGLETLTFTVSALLHERLSESARAAKQSLGTYAAMLLGTAYMAKARPTGALALDTAVARAVILSRTHNTAEIAEATGLSEAGVARVIESWRAEVARGGVA